MAPDEQRERDDLALVLDTWLAIVNIEIANQERLSQPTLPARVTPAMLQQKLRIRRRALLKAS